MANTLILYDGRQSSAERVANAIGYIIGNVRIAEIGESPEEISVYDGFCFIFNFYGALTAGKTKSYLLKNREGLLGKRIAFVGLGFSDAGFTKYVVDMEFAVGGDLSITGMFLKDERTTSEVGYQIAKKLRAPVSVMPSDELSREVDAFINRHTTLALSTGGGNRIRCTPLEYLYLDGIFYIISEGGLKFSNILDNSNVSAAIFDEYNGSMQALSGLQMYGVAEQVAVDSDDYWRVLGYRSVNREVLNQLPVTLFVLRIIPMTYEYLNSSFAEEGYDARQVLFTRFRAERWESSYASLHAAAVEEEKEKLKEKAAEEEKKAAPKNAAVAENEVREELGKEIRDVIESDSSKKRDEDEDREFLEMTSIIADRTRDLNDETEKKAEVPENMEQEIRETTAEVSEPGVTEEFDEFHEAVKVEPENVPDQEEPENTAVEENAVLPVPEEPEAAETEAFEGTAAVEKHKSEEEAHNVVYSGNRTAANDNLNAQKHNLGAEIRKIFQGGGLSFADQLEKQKEDENYSQEEPEDERIPQRGIFYDESGYRDNIPRTTSFIPEENEEPEEVEEEKETYTLEDLERDSQPDYDNEDSAEGESKKNDSGKKKKFSDFFKKSGREELFDDDFLDEDDSIVDEYDEIDLNIEEDDFEEKPVRENPKKKKQSGFFSTGFGRSIGRFLGITPDLEDEDGEDEDEDEDYDEIIEDEEDDFDLSDDEDEDDTEPGWMVRLRERREDEEVEADDAEFYHQGSDDKEESEENSAGAENISATAENEENEDKKDTEDVVESDVDTDADDNIRDEEIEAISAALLKNFEDKEEAVSDEIPEDRQSDDSDYVDEFELEDMEFEAEREAMSRKLIDESVSDESDTDSEEDSYEEDSETEEESYEEDREPEEDSYEEEPEPEEGSYEDDSEPVEDSYEEDFEPEKAEDKAETEGNFNYEFDSGEDESEFESEEENSEAEPDQKDAEGSADRKEELSGESFEDESDTEFSDEIDEDKSSKIKPGKGKSPFASLKKTLFGDPDELDDDFDEEDLDDDELDDDELDDQLDNGSFITNFTDMLRSAIGGIRSGKYAKSDMPKIKIPDKDEKIREDDDDLKEMEAFISGLSGNDENDSALKDSETEDADLSEETSVLPDEEPEDGDNVRKEAVEDSKEAEPTDEVEMLPAESDEDTEEDDEYEDYELDFADDDDSDIIIPGTRDASASGIVIRGFDDDPQEADSDFEEDENDEDFEADSYDEGTEEAGFIEADFTEESEEEINEAFEEEENAEENLSTEESGEDEQDDFDEEYYEDDFDEYNDEDDEDDDYDSGYDDVEWVYEEDDDVADAAFEPV